MSENVSKTSTMIITTNEVEYKGINNSSDNNIKKQMKIIIDEIKKSNDVITTNKWIRIQVMNVSTAHVNAGAETNTLAVIN